jgi:hypothetical protein
MRRHCRDGGELPGPDSISVIKQFSPALLRQTEFFKRDKKHSADLGWSSCCVNTFVCLGFGKACYWLLVAPINAVRGILNQTERSVYSSRRAEILVAKELAADLYELEQKQEASESGGAVMHKISDDLKRR